MTGGREPPPPELIDDALGTAEGRHLNQETTIPTDRKIRSREAAMGWVKEQQSAGRSVVFANGCFDVLHVGHIRFLEEARCQGNALIVGINTDGSVRALKGEGRPLQSESERASLVAALSAVDAVVLFEEPTADRILSDLRPDIHAKGTDYTEENVPERKTTTAIGIRTVIVGDPKKHSTQDMIRKVQGWQKATSDS
jgi:rfaE bifunctional protein nucleotidyltransferase chain/domain